MGLLNVMDRFYGGFVMGERVRYTLTEIRLKEIDPSIILDEQSIFCKRLTNVKNNLENKGIIINVGAIIGYAKEPIEAWKNARYIFL